MVTKKFKCGLVFLVCVATQPVHADYKLTDAYENLSACSKQDSLWKAIEQSEYKESLPALAKFGIKEAFSMGVQAVSKKKTRYSDVVPEGWVKYLHRRGVVSKVKFVVKKNSKMTGLLKGADCGLLRLSVTYKPDQKRDFAPGLALKIFRDQKAPSSNVSALYALEGQKKDYNLFQNPLSNIVPTGTSAGLQFVHSIFARVTDYPEQLLMREFAKMDVKGRTVENAKFPRQVFFVPDPKLKEAFSSEPHDFRADVLRIKKGTRIYKVYALKDKSDFDYSEYRISMIPEFVDASVHIGNLVTTSGFKASKLGDDGLFFRHEMLPKTENTNDRGDR